MAARAAPPRPPLTVAQAADRLGVHRNHVYAWIDAGLIPALRYPSRGNGKGPLRIEQDAIDAFITAHRQVTAT